MTITLVGTGNVAKHLFDAFLLVDAVTISKVIGRNKEALSYFKKHTNTSTVFNENDFNNIILIAVSDDAISSVSEYFKNYKNLVAHTSGSVDLQQLTTTRKGVFYPLQTFTKGKQVDFKSVPFCVEANTKEDEELLLKLAAFISDTVYQISTKQRKSLHLAAVFVNNFTNHLYHIGEDICLENNVPFNILKPLITETANKINSISPKIAQTGPAKRNDQKTLTLHLNQLEASNYQKIYESLTQSIKNTHGEEL